MLEGGGDAHGALAWKHTRGKALLAVGRVDDAIAVLGAMPGCTARRRSPRRGGLEAHAAPAPAAP